MLYRKIKGIWKDRELTVLFRWVKGHSKHKYNNVCDLAAKEAKAGKTIRQELSI